MAKRNRRPSRKAARKSTRKSRSTARRGARTAKKAARRRTAKRPASAARKASARKAAEKARRAPASRSAARKSAARRTTAKKKKTARARASTSRTPAAKLLPRRPTVEHRLHIDRPRRVLEEAIPPGPPSSLDFDRPASAARTGRAEIEEARREHTESSPKLTGGDVDANWASAFSTGDEAPGGDMPTPDQDVVEEIGSSLGVQYADNEELRGADKIAERDRHRWELDPASSEDYRERNKTD